MSQMIRKTFDFLFCVVLVLFCLNTKSLGKDLDNIVEHDVPSTKINPNVRYTDANNVAVYIGAAMNAKNLLVFIGGASNFRNSPSVPFLATAILQGYRVLLLDYAYNPAGTVLCYKSADPCFDHYRSAKVFGGWSGPRLDVKEQDSIMFRTGATIRYLSKTYPEEGWGQYLHGDSVDWEKIAVSGFSQGAGLAAYLAKKVRVHRVILLSSPWDHYEESQTMAAWLSSPSVTPIDRWWGMYSKFEAEASWLDKTYAALGLSPSHIQIVSDRAQCQPLGTTFMPNHWSVAELGCTPKDAVGHFLEQGKWVTVLGRGD